MSDINELIERLRVRMFNAAGGQYTYQSHAEDGTEGYDAELDGRVADALEKQAAEINDLELQRAEWELECVEWKQQTDRLKDTNARLNRRCQQAESDLKKKPGWSAGSSAGLKAEVARQVEQGTREYLKSMQKQGRQIREQETLIDTCRTDLERFRAFIQYIANSTECTAEMRDKAVKCLENKA